MTGVGHVFLWSPLNSHSVFYIVEEFSENTICLRAFSQVGGGVVTCMTFVTSEDGKLCVCVCVCVYVCVCVCVCVCVLCVCVCVCVVLYICL